jgi:hypothetical protein
MYPRPSPWSAILGIAIGQSDISEDKERSERGWDPNPKTVILVQFLQSPTTLTLLIAIILRQHLMPMRLFLNRHGLPN